ncbi:MAG: 5-carboxymethyl-2-hydroxymuconate isomerase [Gammaproteobacteria bacterium]|nr:5-carboxymethyl-2-hydroxymuconate isomerase [Gammaproteobacteria bacterium]HBJ89432.1 5-carboxymethyl-2-hydroxymuconate isomerase [Gammaproteobacteria bacterium]
MSVLDGPRVEKRRILLDGIATWVTVADYGRLQLEGGSKLEAENVVHLAPCEPGKIICPHLTYTSRGIESRNKPQPTPTPTYFMKPITAINAHGGQIVKPEDCQYLNYEGEFAAIIGKETKDVTPEEAWDHIAGFAPALDMGLHDFRDTDSGSMLRVKGADGMCPIGPGIVSGIDPRQQTLRTYRNGELVQEANIGEELVWGPDYMIADLARHITLMPGDIVLTGTPCHSRSLDVGDTIEVEVSGMGRLGCTVVAGPAPRASTGHQATDSDEVRRVALGNDERVPDRFKDNYRKACR